MVKKAAMVGFPLVTNPATGVELAEPEVSAESAETVENADL